MVDFITIKDFPLANYNQTAQQHVDFMVDCLKNNKFIF